MCAPNFGKIYQLIFEISCLQ